MCFVHVHAVGTTGRHAKERRDFEYAPRCKQCGVALDEGTHVAAHVVTYPCANCCVGYLSLQTTCRRCNSAHQSEEAGRCVRDAAFFECCCLPAAPHVRLGWVVHCCCVVHHVSTPLHTSLRTCWRMLPRRVSPPADHASSPTCPRGASPVLSR